VRQEVAFRFKSLAHEIQPRAVWHFHAKRKNHIVHSQDLVSIQLFQPAVGLKTKDQIFLLKNETQHFDVPGQENMFG